MQYGIPTKKLSTILLIIGFHFFLGCNGSASAEKNSEAEPPATEEVSQELAAARAEMEEALRVAKTNLEEQISDLQLRIDQTMDDTREDLEAELSSLQKWDRELQQRIEAVEKTGAEGVEAARQQTVRLLDSLQSFLETPGEH